MILAPILAFWVTLYLILVACQLFLCVKSNLGMSEIGDSVARHLAKIANARPEAQEFEADLADSLVDTRHG